LDNSYRKQAPPGIIIKGIEQPDGSIMKSAEKEHYINFIGILFVSFSLGTRKRKGVPGDGRVGWAGVT